MECIELRKKLTIIRHLMSFQFKKKINSIKHINDDKMIIATEYHNLV